MNIRYTDFGINTISDVEIFRATSVVKNQKKEIYHLRLDHNDRSSAWQTLEYFINNIIRNINNRFVMIITGEDLTFPNQIDPRWQNREHLDLIKTAYNLTVNHPLLAHCFIENRDEIHPKTSSIPIGINPREMPFMNCDYILNYVGKNRLKVSEREKKVICIHRERHGDRQIINKYKNSEWKDLVLSSGNYEKDTWFQLLQTYPLIICAHGGGIDPCPKVWEALCLGCIPIIKHSTLDDIYNNFPVVYVDSWESDTITEEKIEKWIKEYSKYFDDEELHKEWFGKLFLDWWASKILSKI